MYERQSDTGDIIRGTLNGHGVVTYPDGRREFVGDTRGEIMRQTIEAYLSDCDPIDMGNGLPPEPESIPDDDVVEQLTPWMTPMQAARWWYKWGPDGYARKDWLVWAEQARTICEVRAATFRAENPHFEKSIRRTEWLYANNRPRPLPRR